MTLQRLIDLAISSDYIDIYSDNCEYTQLHTFEDIWKDFMNEEIENIQISITNPPSPALTPEERLELIKLLHSYH